MDINNPRAVTPVKIKYDPAADAAYLQLVEKIGAGGVTRTYACDPRETGGMINLDFDSGGRLVGIEIMDASKLLPVGVLSGDP